MTNSSNTLREKNNNHVTREKWPTREKVSVPGISTCLGSAGSNLHCENEERDIGRDRLELGVLVEEFGGSQVADVLPS